VVATLAEQILSIFEWTLKHMSSFLIFRFLRFIKFFRFLRIFRLEVFHELRLMIQSMCFCLKPLGWATLILVLVTFIFAIIFTEEAKVSLNLKDSHLTPDERELVNENFISIRKSFICLLESILGGTDWAKYALALSHLSWIYEYLFLFYIIFVNLGMLNVVTGIFVDSALRAAKSDRQIIIEAKMMEQKVHEAHLNQLFREMDVEGTGLISVKQLKAYLRDKRVMALLNHIGIMYTNPQHIVSAFLPDQAGEISAKYFVDNCMELRNPNSHMLNDIYNKLLSVEKRLQERTRLSFLDVGPLSTLTAV